MPVHPTCPTAVGKSRGSNSETAGTPRQDQLYVAGVIARSPNIQLSGTQQSPFPASAFPTQQGTVQLAVVRNDDGAIATRRRFLAWTWVFVVLIGCADLFIAATFTADSDSVLENLWFLNAVGMVVANSVFLFKRHVRPGFIFRVLAVISLVYPLSPAAMLTVLPSSIRSGKLKAIVGDVALAVLSCTVFAVRDLTLPVGKGFFDVRDAQTGEISTASAWFTVGFCIAVCVISVVVGFWYRDRSRIAEKELESTKFAHEVNDLRNEISRHQEREIIAREVHDHVAHGISRIALQTNLAEVRTHDEEHAKTLRQIRITAQETMQGLRSVVTSLRDSKSEGYIGVAPTDLSQIHELVANAKAGGAVINASIEVDEMHYVSPEVAAAAFRIVQESITNALKNAADSAIYVSVVGFPGAGLHIEVVNEINQSAGSAADLLGTGHGIDGMTERAVSLGGTLTARLVDGVWRTRAFLPEAKRKD